MSENEVGDYDNNSKTTVSEVCSDSEEEWNEDELQETISDMKCDRVEIKENDSVQHVDKNSEIEEGDDELDEVAPSEEINDEVAEAIAPSPRTTRSGKSLCTGGRERC